MTSTDLTPKGAATRKAIVDIARQLLIQEGYQNLAMREVANRCDIKLGNLQYYFATRDALLSAIIEQEAASDLATITAVTACHDNTECLEATITELLRRWRGEGGIVFATLNLLMFHSPHYRTLYKKIYAEFYTAIEDAIHCAAPGISAEECATRARLLTALIDGAAMQTGISRNPGFRDRLVAEALNIAGTPEG